MILNVKHVSNFTMCRATVLACLAFATPISANNGEMGLPASIKVHDVKPVLNDAGKLRYRTILSAIRNGQWADADRMLNSGKPDVLDPYLRAELYLAPKSPMVDAPSITKLLFAAPDLPQATRLVDLAKRRGVIDMPALPATNSLRWLGESPRRYTGESTKGDSASADLLRRARPLIRGDRAAEAEAMFTSALPRLSPAGTTEWQQRLAWAYYTENNVDAALRLAQAASEGSGKWGAQGQWTTGLLHWKAGRFADAATAFDLVATRGDGDGELVAAALYWSARAYLAMGKPQGVQGRLKSAAQFDQSFYGLLAAESLGMKTPGIDMEDGKFSNPAYGNGQVATALVEIGENTLADQIIRHQARIGSASDHDALVTLAGKLSLPETQFFLSHNGPRGSNLGRFARYPAPLWRPESGWRVDPALVFAHGLQESSFRTNAVSAAGAKGVMQVLPSTAKYMAGKPGATVESANLLNPSVNLEYGQSYLEYLNRNDATGGKLPKIIAAYNAGLTPVGRWNTQVGADKDPLLYIESIPYWETRGYVVAVLRNYWMYQEQYGQNMVTRVDLTQRAWPEFPGAGGARRTAQRDR